jgi:hypothetical protein
MGPGPGGGTLGPPAIELKTLKIYLSAKCNNKIFNYFIFFI